MMMMMMMSVEQSLEWVGGKTEMLGENLHQCRFVPYDFTWARTRAAAVESREASD
jgi:hypothetical protein